MVSYNIKRLIWKKPSLGLLLPRFQVKLPHPLFLILYITTQCDVNCRWCYQRQDEFFALHRGSMAPELFEKIIKDCAESRLFRPHLHLFGGEPFSHPEFSGITGISRKYGYPLTVTTNGLRLRESLGTVASSLITQLNISVNAPSGAGADSLAESISFLIKKNKTVNLNYPVTPDTYYRLAEDMLSLSSKFRKREHFILVCQHFMFEAGRLNGDPGIDPGILREQIAVLKGERLNFRLLFFPDIKPADLNLYYRSPYVFRNSCYVPWTGLSVYPDSTVTPGNGALFCNCKIGNLNRQSVREVWSGRKLAAFRRKLRYNDLDARCNRCCQKFYY